MLKKEISFAIILLKMKRRYEMIPAISVVIPVYNVEKYISACLDSVVNQTFTDIEIICVNDGSKDNSLKILEKYSSNDKRIKIINKENGGAASARNTGMENAAGKYIYFLDSDDYISLNALEILYNHAEKNNLDILYFSGDVEIADEESRKESPKYYTRISFFEEAVDGETMFEAMAVNKRFSVSIPIQFFNRRFLIDSKTKLVNGIIHEDEIFSVDILLKAKRVMSIPDVLFTRIVRTGSVMTSYMETEKSFVGYFCVYNFLESKSIICNELNHTTRNLLAARANIFYKICSQKWDNLNKKQRDAAAKSMPEVFKGSFENFKYETDKREALKGMAEYRIGSFIFFIPRTVIRIFTCIKEHGFVYTIKLLTGKL